MDFAVSEDLQDIRAAVRDLCVPFDGAYWRGLEPDRYPEELVPAPTAQGGAPARGGVAAGADPGAGRGGGPAAEGGERDPRGDRGQRRQPRRLPRADVR